MRLQVLNIALLSNSLFLSFAGYANMTAPLINYSQFPAPLKTLWVSEY